MFRHAIKNALRGSWLVPLLALAMAAAHAQSVHAVTEEDAVLHFTTAQGEVAGAGANLVREVLRRAGLEYDMKIYPWPRAYLMAQTQPNVLIFSMARTREREDKFKWVGEVIPVEYRLIKLKSRGDIKLQSLDDARKYSIGVVNQDVAHRFFVSKGFSSPKIDIAPNSDLNLEKLLLGHIDLMVGSDSNPLSICLRKQEVCDRLETAIKINEMKTSLYLAFSEATPDDVVARARTAYEAMRADGTWERIMKVSN